MAEHAGLIPIGQGDPLGLAEERSKRRRPISQTSSTASTTTRSIASTNSCLGSVDLSQFPAQGPRDGSRKAQPMSCALIPRSRRGTGRTPRAGVV